MKTDYVVLKQPIFQKSQDLIKLQLQQRLLILLQQHNTKSKDRFYPCRKYIVVYPEDNVKRESDTHMHQIDRRKHKSDLSPITEHRQVPLRAEHA